MEKILKIISQNSPDTQKPVGCIIIDESNGKIISFGYNKLPDDLDNNFKNDIKEMRKYIIHAEIVALLRLDISKINENTTLISSMSCCINCLKMINNFGIKNIKFINKHKSYKESLEIASVLGVSFIQI